MVESALWGFVGGGALLVGAAIGLHLHPSAALVGRVMAFGAGALICAMTLELTVDAFRGGGRAPFVLGLLAGCGVYYLGDRLIERRLGPLDLDADTGSSDAATMGKAVKVVLGSVLDGIPEAAAIGLSVANGAGVSYALVVAVCISNVPEALMPSVDLRAAGQSKGRIYAIWAGLAGVSALCALGGYLILGALPDPIDSFAEAFAAGAVLTMLSMLFLPEAVERAGRSVGIWTVLGYALATLLTIG